MAAANPLGVGLKGFDSAFDRYDFLNGQFGTHRSVHSSHFQVLAENGFDGAAIWIGLFGYSIYLLFRIRRRAKTDDIPEDERYFLRTSANALLMSQAAFIVGGSFIALSLNDLTWYTFAMVASLDRLSLSHAVSEAPESQFGTARFVSATNIPEPRAAAARALHSRSSLN
jgi:O-antigen ligase